MKKLFYFFIIFYSCSSIGQNNIKNYEIGRFVDYNKKVIDGYLDIGYEPKAILNVSYNSSENFTKGFYWDNEEKKVEGLLKYSQIDRTLNFKLNEEDLEKSIKADESKGFVIGIDTFSVVKNVIVIGLFGDKLTDKSEFAENIENFDGMQFYKFSAIAGGGAPYIRYLVKESKTSDYVTFSPGKAKFKKMAAEIFRSDSFLKSEIENGKYDDSDIPTLIKIFKYRKQFNKGKNIFYNSYLDEINNADKSSYYSKIESVKDSVFHINHFFNNNVKIYEGNFTSFYPHTKENDFIFYYPNSQIRKKLVYKNNKLKKVMDCFEDGKTHRIYDLSEDGTITYSLVNNSDNINLLDSKGNGNESFLDVITNKKITYEYEDHKLVRAYFTNSDGEKTYQLCENNAEIKKIKSLQKSINNKINYPLESIQKGTHGNVLVKCVVEPSGLVSEISILKGLDSDCDNATLEFLSCFKTENYWNPGKVDGKSVKQEIVFPIDFSINSGSSSYRNNYYNFGFPNIMMYQQQQWMNQQMMRVPTARF
jgi:TonB family protein